MHMSPGSMPASDVQARDYKKYAEKYQHDAEVLGKKYGLPPALILALMSRESGFGTGLVDGWGDHHHGFGILQVDNRSHTPVGGPYSLEHMNQAMGIFEGGLAQVKREHPGWTSDQQLAGAVAAYNAGPGNVQTQPTNPSTWAQMDAGTTGNNYSRDVWAQGQWYANNLKW
jgi:soluble lytic murein transglycosylase-like protein